LQASDLRATELGAEHAQLVAQVERDGGALIGAYREPLGGHVVMLVALPIERVEATPFQRDVSTAHVGKLMRAMDKTKRFLDPLIVVRRDDQYLTPNGRHRLTAMRSANGVRRWCSRSTMP
jgi:ParB family chromosome partitioning protein